MIDEILKRKIKDGLLELGIEIRVLPIKNIETDLIPITHEGIENAETIIKWEKIRDKLMKVI